MPSASNIGKPTCRACFSLELLIDLSNELHTSTDFLLTGIGPSNDFAKEEIDTAISILSSIKQLL